MPLAVELGNMLWSTALMGIDVTSAEAFEIEGRASL